MDEQTNGAIKLMNVSAELLMDLHHSLSHSRVFAWFEEHVDNTNTTVLYNHLVDGVLKLHELAIIVAERLEGRKDA